MIDGKYELKFDPLTIKHLGVKMYSTLPPALSELISNAYDADASKVIIQFHEKNGTPYSIIVKDDGVGMSASDIQEKFLVIGRNRREKEGDVPTKRFKRLPTGKKGLGKLALFGLAEKITVDTQANSLRNRFTLNWNHLLSAKGTYSPTTELADESCDPSKSGTTIKLSDLKRKSPFDLMSLADSLSRIFIVDSGFKIILTSTTPDVKNVIVTNDRRYKQIKPQFTWQKGDLITTDCEYYPKIEINLITSEHPIPPSSGLRGVTLFSRGKLVNAPEYFSLSTSSHFFQYLTGWIQADFIDLLDDDVISTNRQAVNWDHPDMADFRGFLSDTIAKTNKEWRTKRAAKKKEHFEEETGIDKEKWLSTLPVNVHTSVSSIIETMEKSEEISASYKPVILALHSLVPEYPLLHWRHLHPDLKSKVESYYKNEQYAHAADQGVKIYGKIIRNLANTDQDGTSLATLFSIKADVKKIKVANLSTSTGQNLQEGQGHLTRGLMQGFRNPVNHAPIDDVVPETFTEIDCLNVLSLVSYLITRLDNAEVEEPSSATPNPSGSK